jgi:hypothetical protein
MVFNPHESDESVKNNAQYISGKDKHMFITFKRLTVVFVFLLGNLIIFSSVVQAQPQRLSVEKQMKILISKLKLNEDQTKKITAILEDQREEITTVMNENRNDRQAQQTAVQEITKKADKKIKTVLKEKQVKIFDKMIKDQQEQ